MKIEFKQKQIEQLSLENLKDEQFLTLALETSNKLGWILGDKNQTGFIAYTNNGIFSWNAEVKMKIKNDVAILQSQSRGNEHADVIGNKKNIQNFIATFSSLKNRISSRESELIYDNLESSFV